MLNYPGLLSPSPSFSLLTLRTSSTQISNACCDLCPLENTLRSAVEVTDVSASDFLLLPSSDLLRDPPSSDSGTFPITF